MAARDLAATCRPVNGAPPVGGEPSGGNWNLGGGDGDVTGSSLARGSSSSPPARRFVTVDAAAALVAESAQAVFAAIERGHVPAINLGSRGGLRAELAMVQQWLASRSGPSTFSGPSPAAAVSSASTAVQTGQEIAPAPRPWQDPANEPGDEPGRLAVGDRDGFGWYGVLEETAAGLGCAECSWVGRHLGLHAFRAHGVSADQYRARHGLRRSRGLVASGTRRAIQDNARVGLSRRPLFVQRRDPAAATARRLQQAQPASPQAAADRNARMAAVGRSARVEVVVECRWCLVAFCPIRGNQRRRRYCSRSCAAKATRRGTWSIGRARNTAAELISDRDPRWPHVRAVGETAQQLLQLGVIGPDLAMAAWLHDIGHAPTITRTGFPALDAARYLTEQAAPAAVVGLVAWHSGAWFEADERRLRDARAGALTTWPDSHRLKVAFETCTRVASSSMLSPAATRRPRRSAGSAPATNRSARLTSRVAAIRLRISGLGLDVPSSHRETRSPPATPTRRASSC